MSIYSNVTEQNLINLRKLSEQQRNERALKIKNTILKKTHDIKLAESFSPITKKLDESTRKLSEVIKESNSNDKIKALPSSSKFSNSMRQMVGSLMKSRNPLKFIQDELNRATVLGVPIQISGDTIKVTENIYELTPEIYKVVTYPTYDGKTLKNDDDFVMLYNILKNLGYTGNKDRPSYRKKFFTIDLPKKVSEIHNIRFGENTDDSDSDIQGEGVEIIILSNIIDIYTRLEILLGLKLSGHTDTLTESSNLIDELYKQGEIQNKQQYRNALHNFQIYILTIILVYTYTYTSCYTFIEFIWYE